MAIQESALKPAVGYVRVSTGRQTEGFSPETQHDAIAACAAGHGYQIAFWEKDAQSGSEATREGYQRTLAHVHSGAAQAIFVYKLDRFGRDHLEIGRRARELERLRVPIISAVEGKQHTGVMLGFLALIAEQYSRDLAQRVLINKERSARAGNHVGITPFGYDRLAGERTDAGHVHAGRLAPNEQTGPLVRDMFQRAAAGWSLRDLALWLNTRPGRVPSPKGKNWTADGVGFILKNPVYYGDIRGNVDGTGKFERCEPGTMFVVKGKHQPIVDKALFDQVQARLVAARTHDKRARIPGPLPLAAGVMVCAGCGGPMTTARRQDGHSAPQYVCSDRKMGVVPCQGVGYLCDLAHDALLAQIDRLQGKPWSDHAASSVVQTDPLAKERARLQTDLRELRTAMKRHIERYATVEEDLPQEMVSAFRTRGKELHDAIKERETDLAALPAVTTSKTDLAALHHELAGMALGDVARGLRDIGDDVGLRAFLLKLVDNAVVVERLPVNRSRWLRAEVTWARNVKLLLDAGLLTLAPDVERPDIPTDPVEARKARQRAYYHRTKGRAR